jgi:hypothetical protein
MLPPKRQESAGAPSGFQVHVIGGGRPAAAGGAGEGLEIGLRIGTGEAAEGAERIAADDGVHRLEAADEAEPVKARPMSEVGPADPAVTLERRKKQLGLGQWTGWMAAASCLLAVAAVGGVLVARNSPEEERAAEEAAFVFEAKDRLDAGSGYFVENSGELIAEAEQVLARYAAATSVEQALRRVRDPERVKERMRKLWRPWGGALRATGEEARGFVETAARPVVCLAGRRGDFSPFLMQFVREDGRLLIDWEASHGIGEVQVAELAADRVADQQLVRAVIRPDNFFTRDFPEEKFRSYQLLDEHGEHRVWAYAALDSEVAALLATEFNEGSVLLAQGGDTRVTVRLSGPVGVGAKCFVITEMLHKGWVSP